MRTFFSKAAAGKLSPSGTVITDIQSALAASGIGQIAVDGLFGGQTVTALNQFQQSHGLSVTGSVTEETWTGLLHTAGPPIFERCLEVTASFEGTGFTNAVGNFDGAGVTWGIIGFTLLNGELGAVLNAIVEQYPALLTKAFGDDAAEILKISAAATSKADKTAWADSVSRGAQKYGLADPWKTYFHDLGSYREVQKIQVARARDIYWKIALRDAKALGMNEELDFLLLYDVAVQNGGMTSKNRLTDAQKLIGQQGSPTPHGKRQIVANVVANTIGKYKNDVLSRKMSIADGSGKVHGSTYDLATWGLIDGAVASP